VSRYVREPHTVEDGGTTPTSVDRGEREEPGELKDETEAQDRRRLFEQVVADTDRAIASVVTAKAVRTDNDGPSGVAASVLPR